ncbi:MAG: ABC transporter permease [Dehalococcoidia bacterium]
MIPYLMRRLVAGATVVIGLITVTFFASHYIGDPVFLLVDREFTSDAERESLIKSAGFDRPVWEQFWDFIVAAAHGDFGTSIWQNRPAAEVVLERLPASMLLAGCTLLVTFAIAIPAAVLAARSGNGRVNAVITVISTALGSLPAFWFALGLIFVFSVELKWLPTGGYGSWKNLLLPVLALAVAPIGRYTQLLEAGISTELRRQYVSTARSKGLSERMVIARHVIRNAGIIGITLLGGEIIALLNGAVLVETIFSWPGAGQIALTAVLRRDLPVLMACVVYIGVVVTVVNLLVDVAYAAVDPRVRFS